MVVKPQRADRSAPPRQPAADVTAIGIGCSVGAGIIGAAIGVTDPALAYVGGVLGMCGAIALSERAEKASYWNVVREGAASHHKNAAERRHALVVLVALTFCVVVAVVAAIAGLAPLAGAVLVSVQIAVIVWWLRSRDRPKGPRSYD